MSFCVCVCVVPGMGNTSPKDMDSLLPLMNMVIYSIDKVKKLRLNREVSRILALWCLIVHLNDHALIWRTFYPPGICRAKWKLTGTGPVWRRTSWSRLTLSGRRRHRRAGRTRREPRRRKSWTRRTLRDSVAWRSEMARTKQLLKKQFNLLGNLLILVLSYELIDNYFCVPKGST